MAFSSTDSAGGRSSDSLEERLTGCAFEIKDGSTRFTDLRHLCGTMQGATYLVRDEVHKCECVLKKALCGLVVAGKNKKGRRVAESVVDEIWNNARLETAQRKLHCRENGLTEFIGWWVDDEHINVVTGYNAGGELFYYVSTAPALQRDITEAQILPQTEPRATATAWIGHVQAQFRTLVSAVHFMHCNNVAHFDLSLENVMVHGTEGLKLEQLKIIDLGIAQHFPKGDFCTQRYCGKPGYIAPEMTRDRVHAPVYDARSADIWCMGVMLFLMLMRIPPFDPRSKNTPRFLHYIAVCGKLRLLLRKVGKISLVTEDALDLMQKMLRLETERISMEELLNHPFVADKSDESESIIIGAAAVALKDSEISATPTVATAETELSSKSLSPVLLTPSLSPSVVFEVATEKY